MNILFLPCLCDRQADGDAETAIRSMGGVPVYLNSPVSIAGVVLVNGADAPSYLTAGVFLGRNYPVCLYAPGRPLPSAQTESDLATAHDPHSLRAWIGDRFLTGVRISPTTSKKGELNDIG